MARHLWLRALTGRVSVALLSIVVVLAATSLNAEVVEVHFTGLRLVYVAAGTDVFDDDTPPDANNTTPTADPVNDADPLATLDFFEDGVWQGSVTTNIYGDVYIPDLPPIPTPGAGTSTSAGGGFFNLLVDSTDPDALPNNGLFISGGPFTFDAYASNAVLVAGGTGTLSSDSLTFPLFSVDFDSEAAMLISFSSTNVVTSTIVGDNMTAFVIHAAGTITGSGTVEVVPEPSSLALLGFGLALVGVKAHRTRRQR